MVSRKKTANSKRSKAAKQGKGAAAQQATNLPSQRLKEVAKNEQDEDAILEEAIMIAAAEKRAMEAAAAAAVEEQRQEESSNDAVQERQRQTTGDAALRDGKDDDYAHENNVRCCHGNPQSSRTQYEFVRTFGTVHDAAIERNEDGFVQGIKATEEKHPEVWNDTSCIESIIRFCLSIGTDYLLRELYNEASLLAALSRYLQEVIAVHGHLQNDIYWTKVFELIGSDEHTLVKYFRRRIPCSCLDGKYNEVKHMTKLGICYNPECPMPDRKIERSKLRVCTRCRQANYCSSECQRTHWKSQHRKRCIDWNSKNQTADVMEVKEYRSFEQGDLGVMSRAVAQEWSEKDENNCSGW